MTEEKTGNPVSVSYTHAQALEILAAGRSAQLKASGVAMIGVFHHPDDVKALIDRELHLEAIKIEDEQDDVAE